LELAGFNIENEYEDGNTAEDMVPLMSEVIFYEAILPTEKLILAFDARYDASPSGLC
jgi:hypothetical protein